VLIISFFEKLLSATSPMISLYFIAEMPIPPVLLATIFSLEKDSPD